MCVLYAVVDVVCMLWCVVEHGVLSTSGGSKKRAMWCSRGSCEESTCLKNKNKKKG